MGPWYREGGTYCVFALVNLETDPDLDRFVTYWRQIRLDPDGQAYVDPFDPATHADCRSWK